MDDPLSCPPPKKKHPRCPSRWERLSILYPLPDGGHCESPSAFPVSLQQLLLTPLDSSDADSVGRWGKQKESGADGPGSQWGAAELGKRSQIEEERVRRRCLPTRLLKASVSWKLRRTPDPLVSATDDSINLWWIKTHARPSWYLCLLQAVSDAGQCWESCLGGGEKSPCICILEPEAKKKKTSYGRLKQTFCINRWCTDAQIKVRLFFFEPRSEAATILCCLFMCLDYVFPSVVSFIHSSLSQVATLAFITQRSDVKGPFSNLLHCAF